MQSVKEILKHNKAAIDTGITGQMTVDNPAQACSDAFANSPELKQSCPEPSIYSCLDIRMVPMSTNIAYTPELARLEIAYSGYRLHGNSGN